MLADDIRAQGWRIGVLALLIFGAMGLLLSRLWTVQVVNTDTAVQRAEEQTTVRQRIAPARGAICDRNGVMLAENRPSFDIDFYLGDLRRAYAESHHGNVPQLKTHPYYPLDGHTAPLRIGTDQTTTLIFPDAISACESSAITTDPKVPGAILVTFHPGDKSLTVRAQADTATADLKVTCGDKSYTLSLVSDPEPFHAVTFYPAGEQPPKAAKRRGEDDIVEVVRESIDPIKDTLGLTAPLNAKDIREHFRTDPDLPYHYMTDLDFATVANFEERNMGVTGIRVSQNPAREYTYGAFASHILGYVGTPRNQTEHLASDGTPYETVGRDGIEEIMDAQLQGEPGSAIQRVSSQGYFIDDKKLQGTFQPPTMGSTLYLTIDARVQYIAETAMRHAGIGRGAVVVMDPNNGDVLAMVSVPSFDPNKFIPRITAKDYDALNQDPTKPLFNRALHTYAPGSTYKIMVALAGLKSGNVNVNTSFDCPGAIQIDDHLFHNSDSTAAGTMSLVHAICVSSDVFFYQYGIKAGIEGIEAMGKLVGFGHKWGLLGDADEDAGIVPGPDWMKEPDVAARLLKTHQINHWSKAQTANTSIGQGFVLNTPLQMATFLCSVANGGTVYQPRLYSRVVDYKGDLKAEIPQGQVYSTLGVKPSDLKAVQEGMRQVVAQGTATLAQIPGYQIAGKTGTAQAYIKVNGEVRKDLKCWFYCYGPFEAPKYVTCVVVEGGTWGGTSTAPIAQEIMSRLFAMDKGAVENIAFVPPVVGNFNGIGAVDTDTNINSNSSATPKPTDVSTDAPANNDASVSPPAADAPPVSGRSSGTASHSSSKGHGR
jgi:penicillin-binding protein 2